MGADTRPKGDLSGYATCVINAGYAVSLVIGASYLVVPDDSGEARGCIRVIDESGDDYLYPATCFVCPGCFEEPWER